MPPVNVFNHPLPPISVAATDVPPGPGLVAFPRPKKIVPFPSRPAVSKGTLKEPLKTSVVQQISVDLSPEIPSFANVPRTTPGMINNTINALLPFKGIREVPTKTSFAHIDSNIASVSSVEISTPSSSSGYRPITENYHFTKPADVRPFHKHLFLKENNDYAEELPDLAEDDESLLSDAESLASLKKHSTTVIATKEEKVQTSVIEQAAVVTKEIITEETKVTEVRLVLLGTECPSVSTRRVSTRTTSLVRNPKIAEPVREATTVLPAADVISIEINPSGSEDEDIPGTTVPVAAPSKSPVANTIVADTLKTGLIERKVIISAPADSPKSVILNADNSAQQKKDSPIASVEKTSPVPSVDDLDPSRLLDEAIMEGINLYELDEEQEELPPLVDERILLLRADTDSSATSDEDEFDKTYEEGIGVVLYVGLTTLLTTGIDQLVIVEVPPADEPPATVAGSEDGKSAECSTANGPKSSGQDSPSSTSSFGLSSLSFAPPMLSVGNGHLCSSADVARALEQIMSITIPFKIRNQLHKIINAQAMHLLGNVELFRECIASKERNVLNFNMRVPLNNLMKSKRWKELAHIAQSPGRGGRRMQCECPTLDALCDHPGHGVVGILLYPSAHCEESVVSFHSAQRILSESGMRRISHDQCALRGEEEKVVDMWLLAVRGSSAVEGLVGMTVRRDFKLGGQIDQEAVGREAVGDMGLLLIVAAEEVLEGED